MVSTHIHTASSTTMASVYKGVGEKENEGMRVREKEREMEPTVGRHLSYQRAL